MGLTFKNLENINNSPAPRQQPKQHPRLATTSIGTPIGVPRAPIIRQRPQVQETPPPMPSAGLKRAINYYADYAGCGWWRMIAPELLMNIEHTGIINGLTSMVLDPRFYQGIETIRLQRQATPVQLEFMKFLKAGAVEHGYKIIYEIDDVIFKDDIPDFNRCKVAFVDDKILASSIEMMQMSDEISVTCQYMKDYYIEKTGNTNVTVVPNYPAKMWMDKYDRGQILANYKANKKRPRVAYVGSGTHIDVSNKTGQRDDFFHVYKDIIRTRHEIEWVFVGAYPLLCKQYIDAGEMSFVSWFPLKDLAKAYTETKCQAVIAPLVDCIFNRAKSNIKYLEASCCGIPGVFQNIVTYEMAPLRFNQGSDMIDQLKHLLKDEATYMKYSDEARAYANTMWLDDHLDEYNELYFTRIGDPERVALLKHNPDQKTNITHENTLLANK